MRIQMKPSKNSNLIQEKSYALSVRIVRLFQYLKNEKREFTLSKQILRSGTSIGANIEEALGGQSRADFISKLSIAYKEARETTYWLRLLKDTDILTELEFNSIYQDAEEVKKILTSIIISSKRTP